MAEIKHTPGPWRESKKDIGVILAGTAADTDNPTEKEFYGGIVIAETVAGDNRGVIIAAPDLLAVAKRYEDWEAKLLMDDEVWEDGLPVFTQELYDEWMEIQAERNAAIAKAKGEADA